MTTRAKWRGYPPLDCMAHIPKDDIWNWDAWMTYGRRVMARAIELGWTSVEWTTICDPPVPSGYPPEGTADGWVIPIPDLLVAPSSTITTD